MQGDQSALRLCDVLRAILDFDGIDAKVLAARMGRHPGVVGKWLRDEATPVVSSIVELADALDAPVDVFVRPPATRNEVFGRMLAHRAVARAGQGEP